MSVQGTNSFLGKAVELASQSLILGVAGYQIISAPNASVHKIMGVGIGVFGGMLLATPKQAISDLPTLFSYAATSTVIYYAAASKGVEALTDTGYGTCLGGALGLFSSIFSRTIGACCASFAPSTKKAKFD